MLPINYEEVTTPKGRQFKAWVYTYSGTNYNSDYGKRIAYGDTKEEAKQRLINHMAEMYDYAPETFVIIPKEVAESECDLKNGVLNAVVFMLMAVAVVTMIVFTVRTLENLTK